MTQTNGGGAIWTAVPAEAVIAGPPTRVPPTLIVSINSPVYCYWLEYKPALVEDRNKIAAEMSSTTTGSASKNPVKAAFRLVQQVWDQPVTVTAWDKSEQASSFSFRYLDVIGNGTFGIVCRARDLTTDETVAIKTVYQDEGHQNRELSIIKALQHQNIVALRRYFYTRNEHREEFLSLVLEWMPTSVDRLLREHERHPERIPLPLIQRAFQQFALALQYLHGTGVCHRDIKPHNLLLDPTTGAVKLCDFGCSKRLQRGESNIQYICARYYRAPEIVLGWGNYSTAIDLWSAGCVLAELLMGRPLFPGKNSIDQLAKIIRVLGAPTAEEMTAMGQEPKRLGLKNPFTVEERWDALRTLIPDAIPDSAVSLLASLLQYNPETRIKPADVLVHPFLSDIKPIPKPTAPTTPTKALSALAVQQL